MVEVGLVVGKEVWTLFVQVEKVVDDGFKHGGEVGLTKL
jgi:hypothetical protein